jgi:hypothetical protein
MTEPIASAGLSIPFTNPVELFPAQEGGAIDFASSYQAVCHKLTAEGMGLLQVAAEAPERVVVGVHCEGRVFFLPGNRAGVRPVGAGVSEVVLRFTNAFDPRGGPPKIEFITEEAVEPWLAELQRRRVPAEEKREHERVVYTEAVEVSGAPAGHPAFALNISEGGIALVTTFPLDVNKICVLSLPRPDGSKARRMTRVVRCAPIVAPFHTVGGQFMRG